MQGDNFGSGGKFWVWAKILGLGEIFLFGRKILVQGENFRFGLKIWVWVKILGLGKNFGFKGNGT